MVMSAGLAVGALLIASTGSARDDRQSRQVLLEGLRYKVLRAGPKEGATATYFEGVRVRYVVSLPDGQVVTTSPEGGTGTQDFKVTRVIPGFAAIVQLMRPGDVWQVSVPAYLALGHAGLRQAPAGATAKLLTPIPPNSPLEMRIEMVAVIRGG